jgi:hypothetical protein
MLLFYWRKGDIWVVKDEISHFARNDKAVVLGAVEKG